MKSERMLKTIGISSIPKGWEWKRIDECFDIVKRKNDNNSENILTISSLSGFVNQKERFSKVIAGDNLKKYTLLRKGEFSYNKGNSKTFPCGCIFLLEDYEEAAVPNVYISFKNKNEISNKFYRYYFQNRLLDGQLKRLINTGVRNDGLLNINTDEFCGVYILVPPIKEQEKISEILSTWDLAIDKQQQLIEKKKEFKKGLMQILLSGEVRFKGFKDSWQKVKLENVSSCFAGGTPSTQNDEFWGGENIWLQSGRVQNCEIKMLDDEIKITNLGLKKSAAKLIKPKSVLIALTGATCGNIAYIDFEACSNQSIVAIEPNERVDYKYLYYKLMSERKQILTKQNGSAQGGINLSIVKKIMIDIPCIKEQVRIGEILQAVDKEVELLEKELEALKLQKKGLMQRLLTGEVRVKV